MIKLKEIMSIIFISYEFVFVSLVLLFALTFPNSATSIVSIIAVKDLFGYLLLFEGAILTFAFTYALRLMSPKEKEKELYNWPDYWRLKYRVFISIVLVFISIALFIVNWLIKSQVSNMHFSFVFVISLFTPVITVFSLFIASFSLREVIVKNSD